MEHNCHVFPTCEVCWSLSSFCSCRGKNTFGRAKRKANFWKPTQWLGSWPPAPLYCCKHRSFQHSTLYTKVFKFLLFWWCVFVFAAMLSAKLEKWCFVFQFLFLISRHEEMMLYFAGHDCVHHWPFDVQEVRTCKSGSLLRLLEYKECISDSTPKWRQSPQTAEGKHRSDQSQSLCNMLHCVIYSARSGELSAFSKVFHAGF